MTLRPEDLGEYASERIDIDDETGCWLWSSSTTGDGYGTGSIGGEAFLAHRWAYERLKQPIPDGLEIDHLCRTRNCVNPEHLEVVTHRENMHRSPFFANGGWREIGAMGAAVTNAKRWGAHPGRPRLDLTTPCRSGHEKTPENGYVRQGRWVCRICRRRWKAAYRRKGGAH